MVRLCSTTAPSRSTMSEQLARGCGQEVADEVGHPAGCAAVADAHVEDDRVTPGEQRERRVDDGAGALGLVEREELQETDVARQPLDLDHALVEEVLLAPVRRQVVGVVPVAAGRRLAGFVAPPHSQVPVGHRFEQRRRQGVRERGARETREVTGAQARPETGPGVGIDVPLLDAHRHRLDLVHLRVHVGDGRPARATRPANSRGTDSMSAMTTSTYDVATVRQEFPALEQGLARFDGPGAHFAQQRRALALFDVMLAIVIVRADRADRDARAAGAADAARQAVAADDQGAVVDRARRRGDGGDADDLVFDDVGRQLPADAAPRAARFRSRARHARGRARDDPHVRPRIEPPASDRARAAVARARHASGHARRRVCRCAARDWTAGARHSRASEIHGDAGLVPVGRDRRDDRSVLPGNARQHRCASDRAAIYCHPRVEPSRWLRARGRSEFSRAG